MRLKKQRSWKFIYHSTRSLNLFMYNSLYIFHPRNVLAHWFSLILSTIENAPFLIEYVSHKTEYVDIIDLI